MQDTVLRDISSHDLCNASDMSTLRAKLHDVFLTHEKHLRLFRTNMIHRQRARTMKQIDLVIVCLRRLHRHPLPPHRTTAAASLGARYGVQRLVFLASPQCEYLRAKIPHNALLTIENGTCTASSLFLRLARLPEASKKGSVFTGLCTSTHTEKGIWRPQTEVDEATTRSNRSTYCAKVQVAHIFGARGTCSGMPHEIRC